MIGLAVRQNDATLCLSCVVQVPLRLSLLVILDRMENIRTIQKSGNYERQSVTAAIGHASWRKYGRWLPRSGSLLRIFALFISSRYRLNLQLPRINAGPNFARHLVLNLFLSPSRGPGFKLHVISVKDFSKRTCTVGSAPCQAHTEGTRLHLRTRSCAARVTRCVTRNG